MGQDLLLVGCGRMGGALLRGWLARGLVGRCRVVDPSGKGGAVYAGHEQVTAFASAAQLTGGPAGLVVLAVKPQRMEEALGQCAGHIAPGALVVSVAAGRRAEWLRARLPAGVRLVRAMPNLPAAIGAGISALHAGPEVEPAGRALAEALMSAVGDTAWLEAETQLDAVTALSGSGPAYLFLLIEAMAAAGEAEGLPAHLAARLARQTVIGAARLSEAEPATPPDSLRRAVTSPGGTTEAAMRFLLDPDAGLPPLIARAVAAAAARGRELSG